MPNYFTSALFVYTDEGSSFLDPLRMNAFGCTVTPLHYEKLREQPANALKDADHVIISGNIAFLKEIISYSLEFHFSIGFIPLQQQRNLARSLSLPDDLNGLIETALRKDVQPVDLILCNEQILLLKATIGRIPMIDRPIKTNRFQIIWDSLVKLWKLRLMPFSITAVGEKNKINTAATGCMIIQHHTRSLASRLISHDSFLNDGMISLIIVAPFSIINYFQFLFQTLTRSEDKTSLPTATGYIKCQEIIIDTETPIPVEIDGEKATETPLHCRVLPAAVRVNLGEELYATEKQVQKVKGKFNVNALPVGNELTKARNKKIPFFTYASEERFRDLFLALRNDAKLDVIYITLMMLSTIIATTGLYLNSASVIIGAMLLAPLMAPIVSLAMGILRQDEQLLKRSIGKIIIGIFVAVAIAAVMTLFFNYKPVTGEMQARLSPTVLDLIVAITAGVAGAYTKSYKEILQSLAGVAIAVALVPPLAVAGIGIGRLDPQFFGQAFLLFSTNLVGITLAATITFRFLGFSPAVKSKRGIGIVLFLFFLITVPLYLSYHQIIKTREIEQGWRVERFFVNGKYLIIQDSHLTKFKDEDVLNIEVLAREQLNREDLSELKRKINYYFSEDLILRANVTYIP